MHKSFKYIRTCKRIIFLMAVFLVYISMYLIHNAYGTSLFIIKPNNSAAALLNSNSINVNDDGGSNAEVSTRARESDAMCRLLSTCSKMYWYNISERIYWFLPSETCFTDAQESSRLLRQQRLTAAVRRGEMCKNWRLQVAVGRWWWVARLEGDTLHNELWPTRLCEILGDSNQNRVAWLSRNYFKLFISSTPTHSRCCSTIMNWNRFSLSNVWHEARRLNLSSSCVVLFLLWNKSRDLSTSLSEKFITKVKKDQIMLIVFRGFSSNLTLSFILLYETYTFRCKVWI